MTVQGAPPAVHKRSWPQVLLALGGFLVVIIAAVIGLQRYGPGGTYSLSQANGLCASAFGQLVQAGNLRASTNCQSVAAAEQARGWLFIAGVLVILGAIAWRAYADWGNRTYLRR